MSKQYRIAIVGIGAVAGMHARAIADIPNASLVAGCCRTQEKGQKFVAQFGGTWYPDPVSMLEAEQPDLITLCTPSGAHLEPALEAAKRGIHVLCEKPLEISTDRIDRMIQSCADAGVRVGGIFPQRYNPVIQTLREAAAKQRFGELAVVNSYVPWWRDDAYYAPQRWQGTLALDGGGAMMNQSIHGVDVVQWIAAAAMPQLDPRQNPVAEVFAFTARRGHDPKLIEVEDTAVAVLRFRNGALGQLLGATSMYPGSLKRIQVAGRDGTAEVLEDELITWKFRHVQDDDQAVRQRFGAAATTCGGAADPMAINYSNHTRNIQAFLTSLESDEPFMLDGPEARKAVQIIQAIYQSAVTGQRITID